MCERVFDAFPCGCARETTGYEVVHLMMVLPKSRMKLQNTPPSGAFAVIYDTIEGYGTILPRFEKLEAVAYREDEKGGISGAASRE